MREFFLPRNIREKYDFKAPLFLSTADSLPVDFEGVRKLSNLINNALDAQNYPLQPFRAGEINAIGVITEIFHFVIDFYQEKYNKELFTKLDQAVVNDLPSDEVEKLLIGFIDLFPPTEVFHREISPEDYLNGKTSGLPNRWLILKELIVLWLSNHNPAFGQYTILFDDNELKSKKIYLELIEKVQNFFLNQPPFESLNQDLISMLKSPGLQEPNSIFRQLKYIYENWGFFLGELITRLLSGLDLIKEEEKMRLGGPGSIEPQDYKESLLGLDGERFSLDRDWMPKLVLIAKNSYVWLDQLSKKYQSRMDKLSDIPDAELARLASWGINGLWLIGIWERSKASARIKQLCGNPEAIASAYALYDYQIAEDLGGEEAYQQLREKASGFGIRLASDMVPNHMAIDSRWVIEQPDWFLTLKAPPFPAYNFSGPNLSNVPEIELYIEDRYYDQKDAAVVFKRVDKRNNRTDYIYHGNDGTSFPWNDTAQLNYLDPEVREAIIRTIIHVAKKFPIIRFDAAMTLTQLHYQRLWFPAPGTGGDIPSRSSHAMDNEKFKLAMPKEFWREVVDRIAVEAPDTLLLAEAFWLMESYFVRTLGMHRVYNSAFMNLLRHEENEKFRSLIKNTLEFDPEILKRFVNFLSNPDEKTAVEQFGKGDKYFGVCTLMTTMPGLPMFGHGQIEGFTEKYGMEYKKAYWDEIEDQDLILEHQKRIFPLLHRRDLFAHVDEFLLYDFYNNKGKVNEDVIAFSNHKEGDSALVVYHNKFTHSAGWIKISAAFLQKSVNDKKIVQKTLAEGLNIKNVPDTFLLFRDLTTRLEYIRPVSEVFRQGLYLELRAYQTHVFHNFRQIKDNDGTIFSIYQELNGKGVSSIEAAQRKLFLRPIHSALTGLLNEGFINYLIQSLTGDQAAISLRKTRFEFQEKLKHIYDVISSIYHTSGSIDDLIKDVANTFTWFYQFSAQNTKMVMIMPGGNRWQHIVDKIVDMINFEKRQHFILTLTWITLHKIGQLVNDVNMEHTSAAWFKEWEVNLLLRDNFHQWFNDSEGELNQRELLLYTLIGYPSLSDELMQNSPAEIMKQWFMDENIRTLVGVNRTKDIEWFHKESFNQFLDWLFVTQTLQCLSTTEISHSERVEKMINIFETIQQIQDLVDHSGYQTKKLVHLLGTGADDTCA